MTYLEFDRKYNKRDSHNVILECSIINLDGDIIFQGEIDKVDMFWDENVNFVWENKKVVRKEINGQEVVMTNLANYSWYRAPELDRFHFEVR